MASTETGAAKAKERTYSSEAALVRAFVSGLRAGKAPWKIKSTAREFDYQRGRTDVVAVSHAGLVVSFEAKLERWKDAMHQAYRNTCFSHLSYVVLPEAVAQRAKYAAEEFDRRAVGICTVRGGKVVVVHESREVDPLQPWLAKRATAAAKQVRGACRTKSSKR
jgi:hypothetical protein